MIIVSNIEIWNAGNYEATAEYKIIPFGSSGLSLTFLKFFYFLWDFQGTPTEKSNNILDVISEKFPVTLNLWSWTRAVQAWPLTEPTDAFIFKHIPDLEAELSKLNVPSLEAAEMVFSSCWRHTSTGNKVIFQTFCKPLWWQCHCLLGEENKVPFLTDKRIAIFNHTLTPAGLLMC